VTSRNTLPLAQHIHHQECWSWQPQEHTTLLSLSHQSLHKVQKETEINTNEIILHSLLIKASSKQSLTLESKISEKLKYVFLWLNLYSCLLQKMNKLFITFKEWSKHLKQERIQLENHLKLSQHTKQFSVMIWKQTIGWMCESIGCFGLTASQPPKTVFNLFQNT